MKGKDEFADALFFTLVAIKLKRDVIFLHVHPESVDNGAFTWIKGTGLMSEIPVTENCPLFLGKS